MLNEQDLESGTYEQIYHIVNRKLCLLLSMAFLFQEFITILWIHLSFATDCGFYINLWFCAMYPTILLYLLIMVINILYKIKYRFPEVIIFFFTLIWMIMGVHFQKTKIYSECPDNKVIQPTAIIFLLSNTMFTWIIGFRK